MIEVVDLHKTYGETVAVRGLSFQVEAGQVLGLVGPNGAGKTTTLRILAGIMPATRGRAFVAGHEVGPDAVAAKQLLAYVPDDPKLFETLTVWEHLEFTAAAYRVPDYRTRAEKLLDRFELSAKAKAMGNELSRGMRQKVAICCAYLHEPQAIFYDEPLTGLDPRGIRTMNDSILERARAGVAVIISSHLLGLVEDLCSHLLIVQQGQQRFYGTVAEARTAFACQNADASLEEVFFRATEEAVAKSSDPVPGDDASSTDAGVTTPMPPTS